MTGHESGLARGAADNQPLTPLLAAPGPGKRAPPAQVRFVVAGAPPPEAVLAAMKEAAFAGGWFHTGDLAVKYPDGYVQLKDRPKDIIISGGANISPVEVEDALHKHRAVAVVAAVARPGGKWGETPRAFVGLKPGAAATAEALIAFAKERLAGFKVPRHVVFAELPKTSTGRIQKHVLRNQARGE